MILKYAIVVVTSLQTNAYLSSALASVPLKSPDVHEYLKKSVISVPLAFWLFAALRTEWVKGKPDTLQTWNDS